MPYQNPYLPQQMGAPMTTFQPSGYMTPGSTYGMAQQQQQQQQPVHGFVYVTGLDGAKAYQMPPNSEMPLFDSTNDGVMFIKTTDGAGFPTISVVDCKKREPQTSQPVADGGAQAYVTHDELDRVYSDLSRQMEQMKESLYVPVPKTTEPAAAKPPRASSKHSPDDGR